MNLKQGPYQAQKFVASLKEVERALKETKSPMDGEAKDEPLPLHWREVFHMARVAPALIDCVQGCGEAIKEMIDRGAVKSDSVYMDELESLSEQCERIVRLAECGAGPESERIH